MSESNTVKIYACGGCGTNVAKYFEQHRGKPTKGFADIEVCYIDTSMSNIDDIDPKSMFHIEGLDGSGKVRRENAEQISESVSGILQKFKPSAINIVLSSAGGGSGSVAGPSLVSELLKRDCPVIVMLIGQTDSLIELNNTINTIKSYESISKLRKKPVNAMYFENCKETPRAAVDKEARSAITVVAALFSKQNKGLDSADLENWLNYTKVTTYEPHLTYVNFYQGKDFNLDKNSAIISVATLTTVDVDPSIPMIVDYQCEGVADKEVFNMISDDRAIHYVNIDGVFTRIHDRLVKSHRELLAEKNARVVKNSILSSSDDPAGDGMIY